MDVALRRLTRMLEGFTSWCQLQYHENISIDRKDNGRGAQVIRTQAIFEALLDCLLGSHVSSLIHE